MNAVSKVGIGHNNPPDPIDEALAPFGDHISEAENWLDGKAVETEAQMAAVDAILKEIKAAEKAAKSGEEAAAKPLHDAWKAEKARWKPTLDDLDRIKRGLAACVNDFKRQVAEEKAAAERKARAEMEAKRQAAIEAARQADASNIEAQRAAAEAQREAEEAARRAAAASKDQVKGLRTVTLHEIEDVRAALHWIAREDKPAMAEFVAEYVRRNHRDRKIDGVRVWTERRAF